MLVLEVRLLAGRYTAATVEDRNVAEWPPHPARVYSALVATWAYEQPADPAERAALAWLAEQQPPSITCSSASPRRVVTHFVPVNDVSAVARPTQYARIYERLVDAGGTVAGGGDSPRSLRALDKARTEATAATVSLTTGRGTPDVVQVLPWERARQARTFPTAIPEHPVVVLAWEGAEAGQHAAPLDRLASRVHRLGHSSTPVALRVLSSPPSEEGDPAVERWVPDDGGDTVLRVPAAGLLDALEDEYAFHQGRDLRSLPAALVPYGRCEPAPAVPPRPVLGDDWLVLAQVSRPTLPLPRALDLARTLRAALMAHAEDPVPEILSGHAPGAAGARTQPSGRPHAAYVPLAFVGGGHGDGTILGLAVVLPRDATSAERTAVLRAVHRWRSSGAELRLPRLAPLVFSAVDDLDPRATLQPATWCRPARRWLSVTPVALDRTPKHLFRGSRDQREASEALVDEVVSAACRHVGLPSPERVTILGDGPLRGVPSRRQFPVYTAGGRARMSVHVDLEFGEHVRGPVLLGAGRYLGQGLLRPVAVDPPSVR